MRIGLRLFLGFFLIVGLAAFFVMRVFVDEVKPGVRQAMESTLVDTANVLAALLARPGAILSREQLMDDVWRDSPETVDRTVDTHVKTLRAKLRAVAPERDPIRTHRGLGYSIDSGPAP
jgi:DNA-binding response OmpR family regulator